MSGKSYCASIWGDPRFVTLQEAMGWNRAEAVGHLVLLWDATRRKDSPRVFSKTSLAAQLIGSQEVRLRQFAALEDAGYIKNKGKGAYTLPDNSNYFRHIEMLQAAGRRGGMAKRVQPAHKTPAAKRNKELSAPAQKAFGLTKEAYVLAYRQRYGVDPVSNAKTQKQISLFIERVGQTDAPEVIRYFVYHPNGYYLRRQHNLDAALADAEGLRTQWASKRTITANDVRRAEAEDRLAKQVAEFGVQAQGG